MRLGSWMLAGISVLLLAVIWIELTLVPSPEVRSSIQPRSEQDQEKFELTADEGLPPLDDYSEIITRPLFNATRRPLLSDPSPPSETKTIGQRGQGRKNTAFTLSGIVFNGDKRMVLLRQGVRKEMHRLSLDDEGENEIDGWTLAAVYKESISLKRGEEEQTIKLERKGRTSRKNKKSQLAERRKTPVKQKPREALNN